MPGNGKSKLQGRIESVNVAAPPTKKESFPGHSSSRWNEIVTVGPDPIFCVGTDGRIAMDDVADQSLLIIISRA